MTAGKQGRKRHHRRRPHGHYSAPPEGTAEELAAHLAPPEERDPQAAGKNGGAIVLDTGALKLPENFAGDPRRRSRLFVDRVVVVVVLLALLFTAFVAWRVSRMSDEPQPVKVVQ